MCFCLLSENENSLKPMAEFLFAFRCGRLSKKMPAGNVKRLQLCAPTSGFRKAWLAPLTNKSEKLGNNVFT